MPKTLRIFLISIFLIFIVAPVSFSVAIDSTTSGRILDNFKQNEEDILFESLPFNETGASDLLSHEYKMNGLDALKSKIALVKQAYQVKKDEVTTKRNTLESAVATLDKAIESTAAEIQETKNQITQKQYKIQEFHLSSIDLKKKVTEYRKIILAYLSNIYSEGNLVLDNAGDVDIMKILILSDTDTDFLLSDMTYKTLVSQLGQRFVDEYRSLVKTYYVLSIQISDEVKKLDNLQSNLEQQSANLQ